MEFRKATINDTKIIFELSADSETRKNSFNTAKINYDDHVKWFGSKINDSKHCFLLFFENETLIGLVRISEESETLATIGVTIDSNQRGKGYASELIKTASDYYKQYNPSKTIQALIKKENQKSIKSFEKAGYLYHSEIVVNDFPSVKYHY